MYLGMLLVLVGWAVYLARPWALAVLPAFVIYMNRFQIGPEERVLDGIFGAEFAAYRRRVRRWL
jgi:protein-S-isoprenylcysteine O-methyltransferase Ste14